MKYFKTLKNRKHKNLEFFITDDIAIATFRDEVASMEHPFFAMKAGDTKIREYNNKNIKITIRPASGIGLATIFDKDIWIYAISKLQQAINNKKKISPIIYFTPYNFFVTTNRAKCSRAYEDLKKSLSRLSGTRIQTNIIYSEDKQETEDFGLIDKWRILEEKKGKLDIGMVEITLPDWLYQAIKITKVLKISPDYFLIRKAIDRRIYEIARKHCGNQKKFIISLSKLHLKSGSTALLKMFRYNINQLAIKNDLPDYKISYNLKNDNVTFTNRNKKTHQQENYKINNDSIKKIKSVLIPRKNNKHKNTKSEKLNQHHNNLIQKFTKHYFNYIKFNIPKGFRK